MSVFHPTTIACRCGWQFAASLVHSANIRRMPSLRAAILDGSFHRVTCPSCGNIANVEAVFTYTDTERGQLFLVFPRHARLHYQVHGATLKQVASTYESYLFQTKATLMRQKRTAPKLAVSRRVVYGLDELREKLVVQEAGYDDSAMEYLKTRLLAAHPVLTQTNRVQLFLHQQTPSHLKFLSYHHNQPALYQLMVPQPIADYALDGINHWIANQRKPAAARPLLSGVPASSIALISTTKPGDTALDDFWVNFRSLTGRYDATQKLYQLADAIRQGKTPSLSDPEFDALLGALPRLKDLSSDSKLDLDVVFNYAKARKDTTTELKILAVRFGKTIGNEWFQNVNATDDIPRLWQVLHDLPPDDVEGNVQFSEIDLTDIEGGSYNIDGGMIQIGIDTLSNPASFEEILRHEVGHAVNVEFNPKVDAWVAQTFGWVMRPTAKKPMPTDWSKAFHDWVAAMGGWGSASDREQSQITNYIQSCLIQSAGKWGPALPPGFPQGHAWFDDTCLPALAFRRSLGQSPNQHWYHVCEQWASQGTQSFAVNFYYGQLMQVGTKTLTDYVPQLSPGDYYAAMSQSEFFAELYAFYFGNPKAQEVLPREILNFLANEITKLNP